MPPTAARKLPERHSTDLRRTHSARPVRAPLRAVPDDEPSLSTPASALRFSEAVRVVIALARRGKLRPPVFRSPPGLDGVDRSIRRRSNGTVVVAIRRSDRPLAAVQADVIEGVIAANSLVGERADRFRRAAWEQLEQTGARSEPGSGSQRPRGRSSGVARVA